MEILGFSKEKRNWLLSVLMKDIKLLYGTIILGVIGAFLGLAVSIFSQKLIDEILPSKDMEYLTWALIVAGGLLLIKMLVSFLQLYLGLRHARDFNLSLIDKFFSRLLFLPKSFYDEQKTGGLIARMHDSGTIHQTVSYIANTLILNSLILVVSTTVLFYYSVVAGAIALLSFPIYLVLALVYKDKLAQKNHVSMEANAKKESDYISTIQNMDLVKTHNKQEMFNKLNSDSYRDFQDKSFDLGKTGMNLGVLAEGIGTAVYLIILSYVSYLVITGELTIGEFTATLGIATGMLYPIGAIGMSILHMQGAKVAFDRMYEFISHESEFDTEEDLRKTQLSKIDSLEFQEVYFSYQEGVEVLQDVTFQVNHGEFVSFFGKNGTGKSTILNIIMTMYSPKKGTVSFNGIEVQKLSLTGIRDSIAIVSQQSKLFDRSVIDNICFDMNDVDKGEAVGYLNSMGFDKYIDSLPSGYHTWISENGKNLSGGQKQVISLARALIKRPQLLLLDEPTASLDGDAEKFVLSVVRSFAKDRMVVMVSHKLQSARESDKIFVLSNGEIEDSGRHEELMLRDNFYSKKYAEIVF